MSSCHAYQCTFLPILQSILINNTFSQRNAKYVRLSALYSFLLTLPSSAYAVQHNLTPFISMQNHYSLIYREDKRDMFPTLRHFGVGSIPWSPLARGLLSHPLKATTKRTQTDDWIGIYQNYEGIVNQCVKALLLGDYLQDWQPSAASRKSLRRSKFLWRRLH